MSSQNPQHDPSGKDQSLLRQIGRNAYRVLGLPANASWRDISQRGSTLQRAAKAGIPQSSPWNLEWYCPLRQDASAVSDALAKLSNPHQRPRERLFWVAQSETFVKYIPIQGLDASIESLRDTYSSEAQHDAAVLALISCFSSDPNVTDSERWEKMLEKWVAVAASEEFWSEFFNSEESGGFDRPASFEELDELRAGSLKLLTGPIAELARDAASRGDFERCRRALGVIRGTRMPAKLVTSIEEDVLGSYEESLNRICKEINKSCWSEIQRETKWAQANEKPCLIALTRWEQEVEPRYYEFIDMSGEESVPSVRVTERYADFLSRIANAHTWAAQWAKAEDLLLLALAAFPQENPAREDIVATLQTISAAASQHIPSNLFDALIRCLPSRGAVSSFDEFERLLTGESVISPVQPPQVLAAKQNGGLRNVAGMQDLKEWLRKEVLGPLQNPEIYEKYRIGVPNGILFYGPPGCGKTYIARAVAEELGYFFEEIKPSDLASPYIHSTVLRIRELFETAVEKAPAVLFIDEFEAFVPPRSELGAHQQYKAEEVNEFLANLEGLGRHKVLLIAATNEPNKIDPAVRRSGRFDKLVFIPPPDAKARAAMLEYHLAGRPLEERLDLSGLAAVLDGYSASDTKLLVEEAAHLALDRAALISTEILLSAIGRVPASITPEDVARYSAFCRRGI